MYNSSLFKVIQWNDVLQKEFIQLMASATTTEEMQILFALHKTQLQIIQQNVEQRNTQFVYINGTLSGLFQRELEKVRSNILLNIIIFFLNALN